MGTANKSMHSPFPPQLRDLSLEETLASLERMPYSPSVENLTFILLKCRKHKNPAYALRFHAYLRKNGLETHKSLGNYLVPMLVRVGRMSDAQQVFDCLVDRNAYSWTSLITGYIECGDLQHAFILYHKMQKDSVDPNEYTFVALLKACAGIKDAKRGQELHADIARTEFLESYPFVASTLVDMYAKCGLIAKAQEVFDKLTVRDVVSWNALIAGYVEHGPGQEALKCFEQMQLEGLSPDGVTYVCVLKACGSIGAIEKILEMHAEIVTKGLLESDPFVGNTLVDMYAKCGMLGKAQEVFDKLPVHDAVSWNTLVDMYAKCGLLAKAQEVFDKLPVRDVISWNALIGGYAEHGLGQDALNCFEQMQLEGIIPNVVTFVSSLKACGSIGDIDTGQEIHAQIAREGFLKRNPFVGSCLVDMYAKCGVLLKAQDVFYQLPVRNAVSWTALIAGYAEHGLGHDAMNCFEQMQLEGVSPDSVTYACSLKACGSIQAIEKGHEIHAQIASKGLLKRDPFVGNTLVDMYAKCGLLAKAQEVFNKLPVQDAVSWNTLVDMYAKCGLLAKAQEVFDKLPVRYAVSWNALITGYAEHGLGQDALNCFEQMQLEGVSPDVVTFVCMLKACGSLGAIDKGQEIHAQIATKGLSDRFPFVGNTLVDMYAKCGLLAKAQEVFDKLSARDAVSWNALIAGYADHGLGQGALNCFEQMKLEGVPPDAATFLCSLKACGSIGAVDKGREIHAQIATRGLLESFPFVGNALVDMYAKCGFLAKAQEVFDELPVQDAVSWNALITGYALVGESENVFLLLNRMRGEGIEPDGVTFLSILTACSHTGLVEKGQIYFEAMSKDYGITPTIDHHNCIIDLLGRAGQLDKAVVMIKKMPFNPNLVLWLTVLGACQKWGNVELARWAFKHAVELDKTDAAAYILMSNIYADAHMQEAAKQVEVMRLKEQAWKKTGQSWTDVGGIKHSLLLRDSGHSQSNYIYANLEGVLK